MSLFNASTTNHIGFFKAWEDLVLESDIDEDDFAMILGVCSHQILKKLTCGTNAGPLPNGAKDMVNFLIGKKKNLLLSSNTLPWNVYVFGYDLEDFEVIHNVYKDPIAIGVVVLYAAHGF